MPCKTEAAPNNTSEKKCSSRLILAELPEDCEIREN